ncbi:ATP-binding cassette domain-containing protein [Streptomyces sp. H27-C3]|uniref:ATP-binding cassette domain-containing protein n=1 Tax=Streptomyces sp. H27-C3 TaxID=3046305 RepID=UPI0024B90126|nr:ATP-binding cassette domain-containing protein [Streptomyces sp. H27-C3]MDJ0463018.1 ATP-binding cassette domain-containing protein [Streptomyces sp. H27-C3]
MLQAIGLTSFPRRQLPPAVDDLTFEAGSGQVTALLGAPGSGKTTALRLMLELEPGRGVTYLRGRPLHRVAHPAREVGVLLGDVPGHPARTARGQLRMLCAAAGVPAARADDMLELVGLAGLGDQRLGTFSLGMDRRLGLASALLGDPHTLLLDEPAEGLSPRENSWLYGLLRGHAAQGGTVLYTTSEAKEAARTADRVVTIEGGRLVADQEAVEFARTRLRPRVAVRTPHAARLGALVSKEARAAQRSVEVVAEDGNRLSVYGSDCAQIGETAFRHGILVHQLADEIGDTGPAPAVKPPRAPAGARTPTTAPGPPRQPLRPARSPLRPLRYELRRLLGTRTTFLIAAAVLAVSVTLSVLLARTVGTPLPSMLAAWPDILPLPPAAFGAGLLGALAFGDEFRYPALASARGTVPRRLGLLLAKLAVSAATALLLALLVAVADAEALHLVYGRDLLQVPGKWPSLVASWVGLAVGCAWAGLLGAGVFRATAAGVAAVLAVPVVVAPAVQKLVLAPSARSVAGLPGRLRELVWLEWPYELDRWLLATMRLMAQPVGAALALSLSALLCAYLFVGLRRRVRW